MHSNTKNSKLDIAIHESGHIILSKVFNEAIEIKEVLLNENLSKQIDRSSLGGIKFKIKSPKMNFLNCDELFIVSLGGFWADKKVKYPSLISYEQTYYLFEDDYRYSGDYLLASNSYEKIVQEIPIIIDFDQYYLECLSFIFANFENKIITKTIQLLSNNIASSSKDEFSKNDIDLILEKSNFCEWVSENKERIKNERFKLILGNLENQ